MDARIKSPAGFACLKELRDFSDGIREGVCATDETGLVIVWNHNAEKLYNVAAADILGRLLTDFFPQALMERVRLSRKGEYNVPHLPRGEGGPQILISANPFYINGVFRGVVATDRNYDEVVKLYADLESANTKLDYLQGK